MWSENNSFRNYCSEKFVFTSKIFFFDVDGTLICTKTGRPAYRPKDEYDFVFFDNVKEQLFKLQKKFSIILISNQSRLNDIIKNKFDNIVKQLEEWDIIFSLYLLKSDDYRKPSIKIFNHIEEKCDLRIKKIKFCGDAAGVKHGKNFPPYEWSSSDYDFFKNIPIENKKFYLPDQVFGVINIDSFTLRKKELIILVGNPGSGKSLLADFFEENGYFVISGDRGMTFSQQKRILQQTCKEKKSIIIDNTNPSRDKRKVFINIARNENYFIRIIWCIRDGRSFNLKRENPVPEIVYNVYSKNFDEPTLEECDTLEKFY